uniref:SH3 domain-containing protein n=1 Tax=Panagrolaimus sp. PS1159 TaxID=55785 RepID=A0AC35G9K0_9BILA
MRWKVAVFFFCFVLFFGNGIYGQNVGNKRDAADGGRDGCDMEEFLNVTKTRKFVEVPLDSYRFSYGLIFVGEEPLSFWLKIHPGNKLGFIASSIWKPKQDLKIIWKEKLFSTI